MKYLLHFLLVLATLLTIAAVRSDAGLSGVWSGFREQSFMFSLQFFFALLGVLLIAVVLSIAGGVVRWLLRCMEGTRGGPFPFGLSAEAMIAGLLIVGSALGRTSSNKYTSPDGACHIEIRRLSWIEAPFGHGVGSFWFVPISITYRDNQGHFIVKKASEYKSDYPGDLACTHTILWSTNGALRAIIGFSVLDNWYYFPDPVEVGCGYPPEQARAAYLRGEPVAAIYQIMREAKNE